MSIFAVKFSAIVGWFSNLHVIWRILIIVEIINIISCAAYRIIMRATDNLTANMIITEAKVPSSDGQKVATVCFGGAMGIEDCFDVFKPYCQDGDFIYMGRTKAGYDIDRQIDQVEQYVEENQITKLRVIGISVGDYAARCLEDELDCEVICLAVNPEPDSRMLKPWAKAMSYFGGGVFELGSIVGGWGGLIEWMPKSGERFSLAYTGDQFCRFASINGAPHVCDRTIAVMIGRNKDGEDLDEFLKNDEIEKYFKGVPVYWVDSNHGNTIDKAEAYRVVLEQIIEECGW